MSSKKIVANLKMNLSAKETKEYLEKIGTKIQNKNVIICPTNIFIPYFLGHGYEVGIQNISTEEKGSYTGEVSAMQARSIGVHYVILGHSERRKYALETDEDIGKKVVLGLTHGLHVILCIGETEEDRNEHHTEKVLQNQMLYALKNIEKKDISNITIAYEPTWSIGSGKIPKEVDIEEAVDFIKKIILHTYHTSIEVLYGGSVRKENIATLKQINNIDGFLIGEASTDPEKFLRIIEVAVIV